MIAGCAPRGAEDYAMHPLARKSVRQAHTLFLYRAKALSGRMLVEVKLKIM